MQQEEDEKDGRRKRRKSLKSVKYIDEGDLSDEEEKIATEKKRKARQLDYQLRPPVRWHAPGGVYVAHKLIACIARAGRAVPAC